jgi:hypothetical protein
MNLFCRFKEADFTLTPFSASTFFNIRKTPRIFKEIIQQKFPQLGGNPTFASLANAMLTCNISSFVNSTARTGLSKDIILDVPSELIVRIENIVSVRAYL